ncbi:MAG: D-glycero-beta-D-manno-heptose 1-phosphate adenylyltransferase [Spirochaetales bacterium]|nr:D-glycero-beta-D-manno-heptose 1-phosphate adenylyltransferase [Spirochaetales bacterium]
MLKLLKEALSRERNYLVVGDIMLDCYIKGGIKRISPEAPVPVLTVQEREYKPGGAGNVALNLTGLNSRVTLIGFTGQDEAESRLQTLFEQQKITMKSVKWNRGTISKTRVVSGKQQLVRIDDEQSRDPDESERVSLYNLIDRDDFSVYKGIIISDYDKGVCSEEICLLVITKARAAGIPVVVDPKGSRWNKYRGATLVTPNLKEIGDVLGEELPNEDDLIKAPAEKVRREYELENLVVTRSEKGMSLISPEGTEHFPTMAREVYDVSGAGDTVAASFLRFLSESLPVRDSIVLANMAAGIVVGFIGTHPITKELLLKESRFSSPGNLQDARRLNKTIVFTNGCFDILHPGHMDYLRKARELGDYLIIGLNSDDSVRRLKGETRPINNQESRKIMLEALSFVDQVVLFEEDTPLELIKSIRPDILVKGGDYAVENIVGREYAGKTMTIPFLKGFSSTAVIDRIEKAHG